MPNPDLEKYIASAREQKISDDSIKSQLVKSGWSESDVSAALVPTTATSVHLPTPPVPRFGMWLVFHYIILFISLGISALALGGVLHFLVNKYVSDPLDQISYFDFDDYIIRFSLASLLVVFPIFATLFIMAKNQLRKSPTIRNFKTRKVLIYITLVITFLIMVYKLISTVFGFLGGEITIRFILHFLVTFLIAGSIFSYLILEVKEDRNMQ